MSDKNQSQPHPTPIQRNKRNQRSEIMQQRYQHIRAQQQARQQHIQQRRNRAQQPQQQTISEPETEVLEVIDLPLETEPQLQAQEIYASEPELQALENTFQIETLGYRNNQHHQPVARPTRQQLLSWINEVSFAVNDITLYLDTHPCDKEALEYFNEYVCLRKKALAEYAEFYGPLTIDTADDCASESFQWVLQPWPWEGGNC